MLFKNEFPKNNSRNMYFSCYILCRKVVKDTLIQNLRLSSAVENAIKRESAAQIAISSHPTQAIGRAPGFSSLIKNSLNVCIKKIQTEFVRLMTISAAHW